MLMYLSSLILFFAALFGGGVVFFMPTSRQPNFKPLLLFSGSYLFAITILHILPELFTCCASTTLCGCYILIGFFLQLFLEFFSKGIEHGHVYKHDYEKHQSIAPFTLLLALCIHAFLDGVILQTPHNTPAVYSHVHHTQGTSPLLLGVVLHKIPAAFALVTVLINLIGKKKRIFYLMLFALASPLGLWVSSYLNQTNLLTQESFMILFAIVGGSFLHISTTIFFESSPGHQWHIKKFLLSLLGAILAVLVEFLF